MFLQRVRSTRLIIKCKLGLTSLHDFAVRQVFCIFVLSVKGSHGSKGCQFSCLTPFLYDTLLRSRAGGVWYREVENFFLTSAENFNVRRSLPCAGETAQTPSYPKLWLEPLLPPSQDNILDFLQFHLFPNHIHRGSLKGSIKIFLQLALNDR